MRKIDSTTEPSADILKRALSNCDSEVRRLEAENARLREALAAAPRWVSVTERPPDDKHNMGWIALLSTGAWVHALYGESWLEYDNKEDCWVPLHGVTHFLELPPAPGTEAEL